MKMFCTIAMALLFLALFSCQVTEDGGKEYLNLESVADSLGTVSRVKVTLVDSTGNLVENVFDRSGVSLIGGFNGEYAKDLRRIKEHGTILSGDLGGGIKHLILSKVRTTPLLMASQLREGDPRVSLC